MRAIFEALGRADPALPVCEQQSLKAAPMAPASSPSPAQASSFVGTWEPTPKPQRPPPDAAQPMGTVIYHAVMAPSRVDPSRVDVAYATSSPINYKAVLDEMRRRPGYGSLVRMAASSSGVGKEAR